MPPLLVPSSLVTIQAGERHGLVEFARLVQRVHAGGRVEHQQHFMRRARQLLADDAMQLLQFLHQIVLGVQASRRVNEQIIRLARLRGGDGIVRHGRRVRAVSAGDDFDFEPLAPQFDLLDGRRAKRVARGEQRGFVLRLNNNARAWREVVVLPVPLTPTMETTVKPAGRFAQVRICSRKDFSQLPRARWQIHPARRCPAFRRPF